MHSMKISKLTSRFSSASGSKTVLESKSTLDQDLTHLIETLASQPENSTCAECLAPKPTWISVTLGIWVCQKCSIVHTKLLGKSFSELKHISHDPTKWKDDQIKVLCSMGNQKAKSLWEDKIPAGIKRPTQASTDEEREWWISTKYSEMEFWKTPKSFLQVRQIVGKKKSDLKRRWVVLNWDFLQIFANKEDIEPAEKLDLTVLSVRELETQGKEKRTIQLEMSKSDKIHQIQCLKEEETDEWLYALKVLITRLKMNFEEEEEYTQSGQGNLGQSSLDVAVDPDLNTENSVNPLPSPTSSSLSSTDSGALSSSHSIATLPLNFSNGVAHSPITSSPSVPSVVPLTPTSASATYSTSNLLASSPTQSGGSSIISSRKSSSTISLANVNPSSPSATPSTSMTTLPAAGPPTPTSSNPSIMTMTATHSSSQLTMPSSQSVGSVPLAPTQTATPLTPLTPVHASQSGSVINPFTPPAERKYTQSLSPVEARMPPPSLPEMSSPLSTSASFTSSSNLRALSASSSAAFPSPGSSPTSVPSTPTTPHPLTPHGLGQEDRERSDTKPIDKAVERVIESRAHSGTTSPQEMKSKTRLFHHTDTRIKSVILAPRHITNLTMKPKKGHEQHQIPNTASATMTTDQKKKIMEASTKRESTLVKNMHDYEINLKEVFCEADQVEGFKRNPKFETKLLLELIQRIEDERDAEKSQLTQQLSIVSKDILQTNLEKKALKAKLTLNEKKHSEALVEEQSIQLRICELEPENQLINKQITSVEDTSRTGGLVFKEDKTVTGGTVTKLVNFLTEPENTDTDFTFIFLLTYRTFTTPMFFLEKLTQRFVREVPPYFYVEEQVKRFEATQRPIRLKVVNVLRKWITNHYYDFEMDANLVYKLIDFLEDPKVPAGSEKPIDQLKVILRKNIKGGMTSKKEIMINPSLIKPPILPQDLESFNFPQLDPLEVARQMCLIEQKIYRAIKSRECLNQAWNHKTMKETAAPNILAMIRRFNNVSAWVASEIIQTTSLNERILTVQRFITIAQHCRDLHNFNATQEILSGLSSAAIYRLKATWAKVDPKLLVQLEQLKTLLSSDGSFATLRSVLHTETPPSIPYLGMYLTDLTFIEDGNPDLLPDGVLINFMKRRRVAAVIQEIQQYQLTPYPLAKVKQIRSYLSGVIGMSPKNIYDLSLMVEPR
eukprot:TRINITY_DN7710_c0_g1_i1.p1 TRINITY_DN7710_c0_g1~~TRINITY_DN7710_c0_g1_i1.p1  ORF type:complete len:1179 (-),score=318.56 TRINITY_DN7710_c0_g1_i1:14-3550(-)